MTTVQPRALTDPPVGVDSAWETVGEHLDRCGRARPPPTRRSSPGLLGLVAVVGTVVAGVLAAAAAGPGTQRTVVEVAAMALRALTYTGVLVAVGGAVFIAVVHDGHPRERLRLRRLVVAAAGIGVAAGFLAVPVQSAVVTGTGVAGLIDASTITTVLLSSFGASTLLRATGLACLLVALPRVWTPSGAVLAAAGATLALVAFVVTGHAATGEARWLVAGVTLVHTATAGIWLGGLVQLTVVLRNRATSADAVGGARVVGRFSVLAGASLAALVPTGTILAARQIDSVGALVSSGYGRALLAKIVLVCAVVAVAAYNRWRLMPRLTRNTPDSWRRLHATVRTEVAGLLLVVVATGLLGRLAPPA